ncbi:pyridoxamine 5'-phosphate oxidase family protein [Nonomuraea sp. NPDC049152]|uniref:pyridoxamine 5'-phosphate oxidase family protein n=1 Tax=Nonomuraea sp. NPDC049152 TaxID=3154350 RepID=UPI0033FCBFF8
MIGCPASCIASRAWSTIFTTAERLKARQARNNPHVALHISGPDIWSFAVAEGEAEVTDTPAELLAPAGSRTTPPSTWRSRTAKDAL